MKTQGLWLAVAIVSKILGPYSLCSSFFSLHSVKDLRVFRVLFVVILSLFKIQPLKKEKYVTNVFI